MASTKRRIATSVRLKPYAIIADAVEQGIAYGYRRAHKYTDAPTEETLCSDVYRAVMNELCEVLDLDGSDE